MLEKAIQNAQSIEALKRILLDMNADISDYRSEVADVKTIRNKPTTKGEEVNDNKAARKALKSFLKNGLNQEALGVYAEKAFDTDTAAVTIEDTISRELNELAINNSIVLSQFRNGALPDGSPYTVPKIDMRPVIARAAENKSGTPYLPTDAQTYVETTADFCKSASMPAFTHESLQDSVRDIEADCIRLIAEERTFDFIQQALFGDGMNVADQLRGLLSNRIDSANNYAEAQREDDVRSHEYLKVHRTGVPFLPAGADLPDFLIDVQMDVNWKYQENSAWYLSKEAFAVLRKLRVDPNGADERPLMIQDFGSFSGEKGTSWMMMGKPVYIIDQLDGTDIPLFYGDLNETLEFGLISGSEHFLIDEITIKGQKALYADQRFYSVLHNNDAVRVVVTG
ncbi:phage major capsid protein [Vibrio owensii]|uniref:phage major capsid protein n=1 Tax=Vibrio owensii TaxID=696485 RepID=UPI002F3FB0ED